MVREERDHGSFNGFPASPQSFTFLGGFLQHKDFRHG